jgi:hypothetical protein
VHEIQSSDYKLQNARCEPYAAYLLRRHFSDIKRHMRATYRSCEARWALLTCSASDFEDIQALLWFAQTRAQRCHQMARYFSSYRYSSLWYRCVVVVSSACA